MLARKCKKCKTSSLSLSSPTLCARLTGPAWFVFNHAAQILGEHHLAVADAAQHAPEASDHTFRVQQGGEMWGDPKPNDSIWKGAGLLNIIGNVTSIRSYGTRSYNSCRTDWNITVKVPETDLEMVKLLRLVHLTVYLPDETFKLV